MKKSTLASVGVSTLVSVLAVSGVAYAASINATSKLGGSSGDDFEFDGTGRFNSVVIGKQGSGGVTFFNGTIVNGTTTNGNDNPVTFGDNVRIDGRVYRGANAGGGLGDSNPFVINDDAQVAGSLTVGGTDIFAEIDTKASKTDVYTKTEADSAFIEASESNYLAIPAAAFNPAVTTNEYSLGSGMLVSSVGNTYFAPLSIPVGATLKSMTMDYNASTTGMSLRIIKHESNGFDATVSNGATPATIVSSDTSASVQSKATDFTDYVVEGGEAFYLELYIPTAATHEFHNAYVVYDNK